MKALNKTVVVLLIFCCDNILKAVSLNKSQTFKLYSDNHIESFQKNFENLDQVSNLSRQSESDFFCSERGAWIGFNSHGFVNSPGASSNSKLFKESVLPSCRNLPDANGRKISQIKRLMSATKLGSIRHIGHLDVESSALSLYELSHFGGTELYFDGTSLSLPKPIRVKSYGFTGNESWTLFENLDLSGQSKLCLDGQTLKNTMIDTVTVEGDVDFLKVGSIQRGCSHLGRRLPVQPENSLTLHSSDNKSVLFLDGSEVRLPFPQSFRSFSLIGHATWTVFEGTELTGPSQCLRQPTDVVPNIHETEFHDNYLQLHEIYTSSKQTFHENLMIGSIKQGCVPIFLRRSQFNAFSDGNVESRFKFPYHTTILGTVLLIVQNWMFLH